MLAAHERLISDVDELAQLSAPWRELAHACACPAALPGWQLAWWRHLAPTGARLRVIAVYEGESLVGLAPFFANPGRRVDYRLLGGEMVRRNHPLARPGFEEMVAGAIARTLAAADPSPDLVALEAIDTKSDWPSLLSAAWPSRFPPWAYTSSKQPGPVVESSESDFESWLAGRSRNFRRQLRVAAKRAVDLQTNTVFADSLPACESALEDFQRLHLARWSHRGGSSLGDEEFAMINDASRTLFPVGDMRVLTLTGEQGHTIAVLLALAAGGALLLFSYGFDEEYASISPIHLIVLAAIEDAFRRGERRIDFGGGGDRHKLSFANSDDPIEWSGFVVRSRRYPLTRMRLAPVQSRWLTRRLARRFLSPRQRAMIKGLFRR